MHLTFEHMKKVFVFILVVLTSSGCKNYLVNSYFRSLGAYDDKINLDRLGKGENDVVFIPMHHLGTALFYDDVKDKVDSLKKAGFYFYTEKLTVDIRDTVTIRKVIKLTGIPFSKDNSGYKDFFDSMYAGKVKFEKQLINQPKYPALGLDSSNSRTVDVTYKELISYYEKLYGELKLEPCDFDKSFYEKSSCNDNPLDKKVRREVFLNFRNTNVVNSLLKEDRKKVAIIYGADHFKGIKEELLKQGYVQN